MIGAFEGTGCATGRRDNCGEMDCVPISDLVRACVAR